MQNNPITEVAMPVVASVIVIAGSVLLYLGKIDFTQAMLFLGAAVSLLGVNGALKVPSPAQQAQQDAQQQNVQQLLSQALAVLPVFASLLHSHTPAPQAPVAPPQPQQAAVPVQPAVQNSPAVASPSVPTAMLQPQVAPVLPQRDDFSQSALMRAVGQFPPQPAQTAQPVQPAVSPVIPARPSLAHPGASNANVQQQQFRPQPVSIPEVSMPLAAIPKP